MNKILPFMVFSVPPEEPHDDTAYWGFLIFSFIWQFGDKFSVYALACAIELFVWCNGQTTFTFIFYLYLNTFYYKYLYFKYICSMPLMTNNAEQSCCSK